MSASDTPSSASLLDNGRDLGGLGTGCGRRVRNGRLFRSAAPDFRDASARDVAASLGLRRVFDFRMAHESAEPSWGAYFPNLPVWTPTRAQAHGDPHALLAECLEHGADPAAIMANTYRRLPHMLREHIAAIVRGLLESGGPVLFHCAAGKDRTGVAAATLLSIVGVDRDDIYADYLLSNAEEGVLVARYLADPRNEPARKSPYARWRALMVAEPGYLDALFDEIERVWGDVEGYAVNALALSPDELARFRAALLD